MKKEKSLLLAVGTSIAALAMVFTISSCSGDNGKDGANGENGQPGGTGAAGTSCTVEGDGPWTVKCGTTTITIKNGNPGTSCTMTADAFITCGNMTVGICADGAYDPEESYCAAGTTTPKPDCGKASGIAVVGKYSPNTQYCEMTSSTTIKISDRCGNLADGSNPNDYKNGTGSYSENNFCRFTGEGTATVGNKAGTAGLDYCMTTATNKALLNEGSWKGDYCEKTGAATNSVSEACDFKTTGKTNIVRPNELSTTNKEYCQWTDENTVVVAGIAVSMGTHSAAVGVADGAYCATVAVATAATGAALTDIRINEGSWKNQYCGLEQDGTTPADGKLKVLTVDEAKCVRNATTIKPNAFADPTATVVGKWNDEYCQWTKAGVQLAGIITVTANGKNAYCLATVNVTNIDVATKANIRMNDGSWEAQYCGWGSTSVDTRLVACGGKEGDGSKTPNSTGDLKQYCAKDKDGWIATGVRCLTGNDGGEKTDGTGDEFNKTAYTHFCMKTGETTNTPPEDIYALAPFCGFADGEGILLEGEGVIYGWINGGSNDIYCFNDVTAKCSSNPPATFKFNALCNPAAVGGACQNTYTNCTKDEVLLEDE